MIDSSGKALGLMMDMNHSAIDYVVAHWPGCKEPNTTLFLVFIEVVLRPHIKFRGKEKQMNK